MNKEDEYVYSAFKVGDNGYGISAFHILSRACTIKCATSAYSHEDMLKDIVLSAVGINPENHGCPGNVLRESIGAYYEPLESGGTKYIAVIPDKLVGMMKVRASNTGTSDDGAYFGTYFFEYVTGIKVNYNEESTK